jgi:hypothetical protein
MSAPCTEVDVGEEAEADFLGAVDFVSVKERKDVLGWSSVGDNGRE